MAISLSVNLNKIALLRNSRAGDYPSVLDFAKLCLAAGANGITVHPRPDQRHIKPTDCQQLSALINPMSDIEFNIEGNPLEDARDDYNGFINLVLDNNPDQATLVPDATDQKTSDHGFDLNQSGVTLEPIIAKLKTAGIRVSLFMDPDIEQIKLAKQIGADRIELYTGPFAAAYQQGHALPLFQQHIAAAQCALSIGLGVNAGHDLNLDNMTLYRHLPGLAEVSIGHALMVESLTQGIERVIHQYLTICSR